VAALQQTRMTGELNLTGNWVQSLSNSGHAMKMRWIVATVASLTVAPLSSAWAQAANTFENGSGSASAGSWVVGAQAGYNWQRDWLVYGVEADISGVHLHPQVNTALTGGFPPPVFGSTSSTIDWYGTVRGRAGWSSGPLLFYGTAGLAYGKLDLSSSLTASAMGLATSAQTSSDRAGWVAGVGIGYLWTPNVVLNIEYQHVDLGGINLASSTGPALPQLTQSASASGHFEVVTVGLSWLFAPAGGTRAPWQGGYVGGHAGGVWGDNTTASYAGSAIFVSDTRLKRGIVLLTRLDNGLGIYRYRYLWSDVVYVGVMAQEVALIRPDAVVRSPLDDYLQIDYARLGLELMTLPEWEAVSQGKTL
jgi:outer membrane immunogenic protein